MTSLLTNITIEGMRSTAPAIAGSLAAVLAYALASCRWHRDNGAEQKQPVFATALARRSMI